MRKVTEEFKERLREAFRVYGKSGVPEEALLEMTAMHAIGLLEVADQHPEWFEPKTPV